MCRYKPYSERSNSGDYYTLGIHRTAQFTTPTSQPPLTDYHTSTSSEPAITTSGSRDVAAERQNTMHSRRTFTVNDRQVATLVRSTDEVLYRHKLTSDRSTTTTTSTIAADQNDASDASDEESSDSEDDDDDDVISQRVAAVLYRGIR